MSTPFPTDYGTDASIATRIVGLGASAGGLEVLEQFLANVPAASGLAYIVVQHLDPTQKALLAELLQRSTAMPVQVAAQSVRVEPDVVYVIPPNSELTVKGGQLQISPPIQPRGMRLPVDVLFSSLAQAGNVLLVGNEAPYRPARSVPRTAFEPICPWCRDRRPTQLSAGPLIS